MFTEKFKTERERERGAGESEVERTKTRHLSLYNGLHATCIVYKNMVPFTKLPLAIHSNWQDFINTRGVKSIVTRIHFGNQRTLSTWSTICVCCVYIIIQSTPSPCNTLLDCAHNPRASSAASSYTYI